LVLDNPIVLDIYNNKKILHLRVNASFFELNGWVADKRIFCGDFDPNAGGWSSKSKGEIMIKFEGDDQRTKCSIKVLLQHHLVVIREESDDEDPDGNEPPITPKNTKRPTAIDPNATQQYNADSSDDEDAHRADPGRHAMHACPPPHILKYPSLA